MNIIGFEAGFKALRAVASAFRTRRFCCRRSALSPLLVAWFSSLPPALPLSPTLIAQSAGMLSVDPDTAAGPEVPVSCRVAADRESYRVGDVAVLTASCAARPSSFRARAAGKPVPVFPAGGALWGLVGFDLSAGPGEAEFEWEAAFATGASAEDELILRILPRTFPVQRLKLPPRFVHPDTATLRRIEAEREHMQQVLARRTPERAWHDAFEHPLPGVEGGGFGARRILNGVASSPHGGLDLAAPTGEPVRASNEGVVALVDTLYYAGRTVVVDHGLGLFTIYSHLSAASVASGQRVAAGQVIGRVGATGRVTGSHLHWAAVLNGARVDPLALVAATARLPEDARAPR